ncbi:hypothetical protein QCA50_003622 [Cerrena zonata]|uniref:Uncharacterized protein n=1 Tax=Cerrena zonata TaxID=2478898 RepID=A0AAW0GMS5_9APHY
MDTEDIRASPLLEAPELSDSEELPESSDLLNILAATSTERQKKTPTETDYSDSEFDSLIRAVDLPNDRAKSRSSVIDLSSPSPKKNRSRQSSEVSLPVPKRTKYSDTSSKPATSWNKPSRLKANGGVSYPIFICVASSLRRPSLQNSSSCLILTQRDDPYDMPTEPTHDEDFVLDESLFDIVPAEPTSSSPSHLPDSTLDMRSRTQNATTLPAVASKVQPVRRLSPPPEPEDPLAAQLAEFEDWFYNSGQVVIADKVDN